MRKCPVCEFRNPDSNDKCLRCSALLRRETDIINQALYEGARKAKSYQMKRMFVAPVERIQRMFDFPSWRVQDQLPYRFPFTAGALSLIPGLGQCYNHQAYKGLTLGAAWLVWLALCIVTITQPFSNWLLLALVIGWLLIWNDAISTSIRSNGQYWSLRNSLAMFCALLFILGILLNGLQFFGLSMITLVRVRSNVHAPVIQTWDRVWVNHLAYIFADARYGDVVYYDPPRFWAEQGENQYVINIGRYFQRVLAQEGDRIEKRQGKWYRNGMLVPEWQLPFGDDMLPEMAYTVPLDCIFAPVTYIPPDTLTVAAIQASGKGVLSDVEYAFQPGFVFMNWEKASMPSVKEVWGRGVAVVDPPEHRSWLRP